MSGISPNFFDFLGGSLRSLCTSIDPNKSVPLEVLINWAAQVASGMAFLRERGLVHRDLKADNGM